MLKHYKSTPNYWQHITQPLEQKLLDMGCKIQQMKEKFGELRVYWSVEDWDVREEADKLVEQVKQAAEEVGQVATANDYDYDGAKLAFEASMKMPLLS